MKRFLLFLLQALLLPAGLASAQLVVAPTSSECATSTDGSVVGVPNPLQPPQISVVFSGTLPSGNYFTVFAWYDAASHVTLVSPEIAAQLSATGQLQIAPPANGQPATAAGMQVFIGTSSGAETLQGTTTGSATFIQSTPLATGTALPSTNTTLCQIIANDAGWPTGTGYQVSMTTPGGDTYPGYPMQWQLLGPGGTINLGNGLPLYNGVVTYPVPILAYPYGHATQSIAGGLNIGNYSFAAGSGIFSTPGIFSNFGQHYGLGVGLGGWNPNNVHIPGSYYTTDAVNAGVDVPSTAAITQIDGLAGTCSNGANYGSQPGALNNCVGVYGIGYPSVNDTSDWGMNSDVGDTAGITGSNLTSFEADWNVVGTPNNLFGVLVGTGFASGTFPPAPPVTESFPSYTSSAAAEMMFFTLDVTHNRMPAGIVFGKGTVNGPALQISGTCFTGTCNSATITMTGFSSGTPATATLEADDLGNIDLTPASGSGVAVTSESASAGQAACFTTGGVLGHCTTAVNSSGACTCVQ